MAESVKFEVVPTMNESDAPFQLARYVDGAVAMRRDSGAFDPGWTVATHVPHAVLMVDGVMSEFDRNRRLWTACPMSGRMVVVGWHPIERRGWRSSVDMRYAGMAHCHDDGTICAPTEVATGTVVADVLRIAFRVEAGAR